MSEETKTINNLKSKMKEDVLEKEKGIRREKEGEG